MCQKIMSLSGWHAVPRTDHVLETDPFFSFHHVNAYEVEGTSQIVIDTAAMDDGIDFSLSMDNGSEAMYQRLSGRAVLTRLVCDLSSGKVRTRNTLSAPAKGKHTCPCRIGCIVHALQPHCHSANVCKAAA